MEFKRVTIQNIDRIKPYILSKDFQSSSFTLGVLFLWADDYKLSYCEEDETIIFRGYSTRNNLYYSYPLGKNPWKLLNQLPKPYTLLYVPEHRISEFPGCRILRSETDFDYVYRFEDLYELKGKSKASYRNHINRFLKDHPENHYEILSQKNIPDVIKILNAQTFQNPGRADDIKHNYAALCLYDKLPFTGGILYSNGSPAAFSIGEVIGDMLYVEFEKRVDGVDGAPDYNRVKFLSLFADKGVRYVNREEDCGDPGLRTSKMRMGPDHFIYKYRVDVQ